MKVLLARTIHDGNLPLHALAKRDHGLRGDHARYLLDVVVEQIHQVFVVTGIDFHQQCICSRGKVAFGYLGNLLELRYHVFIHRSFFQLHADISAGRVSQNFWIHVVTRSGDHLAKI